VVKSVLQEQMDPKDTVEREADLVRLVFQDPQEQADPQDPQDQRPTPSAVNISPKFCRSFEKISRKKAVPKVTIVPIVVLSPWDTSN
jgi:hypothetical protein